MGNHTKLTNQQYEFVEWLKLGSKDARIAKGEPPTIEAFAKKYGVAESTLYNWKQDPDVKRAVVDHGVTLFTVDEIKAARDKLVSRAVDEGNVQAIKMILDIAGVTPQKIAVDAPKVSIEQVTSLSDAELDAKLRELEDD